MSDKPRYTSSGTIVLCDGEHLCSTNYKPNGEQRAAEIAAKLELHGKLVAALTDALEANERDGYIPAPLVLAGRAALELARKAEG